MARFDRRGRVINAGAGHPGAAVRRHDGPLESGEAPAPAQPAGSIPRPRRAARAGPLRHGSVRTMSSAAAASWWLLPGGSTGRTVDPSRVRKKLYCCDIVSGISEVRDGSPRAARRCRARGSIAGCASASAQQRSGAATPTPSSRGQAAADSAGRTAWKQAGPGAGGWRLGARLCGDHAELRRSPITLRRSGYRRFGSPCAPAATPPRNLAAPIQGEASEALRVALRLPVADGQDLSVRVPPCRPGCGRARPECAQRASRTSWPSSGG